MTNTHFGKDGEVQLIIDKIRWWDQRMVFGLKRVRERSPAGVIVFFRFVAVHGPTLFFMEMGLAGFYYLVWIRPLWVEAVAGIAAAVTAAGLTKVLIDVIAHQVGRIRPFVTYGFIPLVDKDHEDPSFPSNHAGGAWSLATVLSIYFPNLLWISVILAVLLSFSRVYVGVHYLMDVLVGAWIGLLVGVLTGISTFCIIMRVL